MNKKRDIVYKNEELLNAISHGLGVILGIIGLIVLFLFDSGKSPYSMLSILFYGISVIVLYTASTIYHAVIDEKRKFFWRKLDHISIYLLIAGTYTPLALIALPQQSGWMIFWVVWGIAILGTILKIFFTGRFEALSLILYLVMGWLIVFNIDEVVENTTSLGLNLMMLGGAFYTLGIIFYAIKKIPYNHFVWHLFVLGGSISHFLFIFLDII